MEKRIIQTTMLRYKQSRLDVVPFHTYSQETEISQKTSGKLIAHKIFLIFKDI